MAIHLIFSRIKSKLYNYRNTRETQNQSIYAPMKMLCSISSTRSKIICTLSQSRWPLIKNIDCCWIQTGIAVQGDAGCFDIWIDESVVLWSCITVGTTVPYLPRLLLCSFIKVRASVLSFPPRLSTLEGRACNTSVNVVLEAQNRLQIGLRVYWKVFSIKNGIIFWRIVVSGCCKAALRFKARSSIWLNKAPYTNVSKAYIIHVSYKSLNLL